MGRRVASALFHKCAMVGQVRIRWRVVAGACCPHRVHRRVVGGLVANDLRAN